MTIPNKSKLTFAGEYFVEEASIQTQDGIQLDITNQLSGIALYEDIFSPFITGSLFIKDTLDLPNVFGRGGMNILHLKIGTPAFDTKIDSFFHIYKMSDRVESRKRMQAYTMQFISIESLYDQKRISAAFKGSPHKLVEEILTTRLKTKKKLIYSEAAKDIKYVSNFWTASKNISYITEHASKKDNVANFLFFENRDGFNFTNISDLVESKPIQNFENFDHVATPVNDSQPFRVTLDPELSFKNVLEFDVDSTYDYMSDYDAGMIKTRLYIADPIRKNFTVKNYSLNADKAPLLNGNNLYSDNVINLTEPQITSKTRFYNVNDVGDSSNSEYLQNRVAQLRKLQAVKIEIEVFGRVDYTVGKKISFDTNKMMPIDRTDTDITDQLFSGDYIISAIHHKFGAKDHRCIIELIKDSVKI